MTQATPLQPDLILLDLRMPKLDGLTAADKILAERRVPIILLSGMTDNGLRTRAEKIGVAGFAVKPVDRPQLVCPQNCATPGRTTW